MEPTEAQKRALQNDFNNPRVTKFDFKGVFSNAKDSPLWGYLLIAVPWMLASYALYHNMALAISLSSGFASGASKVLGILTCEFTFIACYHLWIGETANSTDQRRAQGIGALVSGVFITLGLFTQSGAFGESLYFKYLLPIAPVMMTAIGAYVYAKDPQRELRLQVQEGQFKLGIRKQKGLIQRANFALEATELRDDMQFKDKRLLLTQTRKIALSNKIWSSSRWSRKKDAIRLAKNIRSNTRRSFRIEEFVEPNIDDDAGAGEGSGVKKLTGFLRKIKS